MRKGAMKLVFGVAAAAFWLRPSPRLPEAQSQGKLRMPGRRSRRTFSSPSFRIQSSAPRTRTRPSWMAISASSRPSKWVRTAV